MGRFIDELRPQETNIPSSLTSLTFHQSKRIYIALLRRPTYRSLSVGEVSSIYDKPEGRLPKVVQSAGVVGYYTQSYSESIPQIFRSMSEQFSCLIFLFSDSSEKSRSTLENLDSTISQETRVGN